MTKDPSIPNEHHVHRTGAWLPQDHRAHTEALGKLIDQAEDNKHKELHPALKRFQDTIESDTRLYLLFTQMFDQIPKKKQYKKDPSGQKQVKSYHHMLRVINHILTTPPNWITQAEKSHVVGLPINALLDWPMGTSAGFAAFLDPEVNKNIKDIIDVWGDYLKSPASASCLGSDPHGWFSPTALEHLEFTANLGGQTSHKFEELFVCDPKAEHHGFKSWDDFFTRTFRFDDGIRPVASPEDDSVIANACESLTYAIAHDVKARDRFWVKGQPYSVLDMLARDSLAPHFIGGTIYQAFLSALSYHRWHTPVSGKIVKSYVIPGTYYSEPLYDDFTETEAADPMGESTSQGYITAAATRGAIFIEADNAKIGLIALLFVGMAEVSTSEITVKEGQVVKKGEQLGMFHFGGSTHCILFRKGVEVSGFPETQAEGRTVNVPVRGKLAIVK